MTIRCPVILIIIDPDDRRKCVECTTWMTWNCDELRPEDPGGTAVPALHKFVPAQQLRESSPHKNFKENGKNWSSGPLKCPAKVSRRPTKWILLLSKCYHGCPLFHDVSISKRNMTFGPRLWGLQIGSQFAGLAFLHFEAGLQKSLYGASMDFHGELTRDDPWRYPASNCWSSLASFSFCACDSCRSRNSKNFNNETVALICLQLSHSPKRIDYHQSGLVHHIACSRPLVWIVWIHISKNPGSRKKICISMHIWHMSLRSVSFAEKSCSFWATVSKRLTRRISFLGERNGWHWSRNIRNVVLTCERSWPRLKTQGPLAKNCPSKLSKSVKFTGVLEKELLDWWQA